MANTQTEQSALEHAEEVLHELEDRKAELAKSSEADSRELAEVSFAAHTSDDQKAAARLETIKTRAVKREVDTRSIDAAIEEAKRHVAAAKDAERQAEEARVAAELAELAGLMREAGRKCDRALARFIEGSQDLLKIVQAINVRGLGNPSAQQLQSLGERAVRGAMVDTPFARAFERIAPHERQNLAKFTESWASAIERTASIKLNREGGEENAA